MRDALAPPPIRPWVPGSHSFVPSKVTTDYDRAKASGQSSVPAPVTSSCTAVPATRKHRGDSRWLTGRLWTGLSRGRGRPKMHIRAGALAPHGQPVRPAACGARWPWPADTWPVPWLGLLILWGGASRDCLKVNVRETSRRSCRAACRLCPGGRGVLALCLA